MEEEKETLLNKRLDLAFVYIFIFIFGLVLVFAMTHYLKEKVNEFSYDNYTTSE